MTRSLGYQERVGKRTRGIQAALLLVALSGCNRKLPLEAKVVGYKPGSSTILLVEVKSNSGARVECMDGGLRCEKKDVGAPGAVNLEIDMKYAGAAPMQVMLHAAHGPRENTLTLPLDASSGMPAKLDVAPDGKITCTFANCTGTLVLAPTAHLTLTTTAGTVAELGTSKATASAGGTIDADFVAPPVAALRSLSLRVLCATPAKSLGALPLTLTFPDQVKLTTSVALDAEVARRGFAAALEQVAKGPVVLPWEKPAETIPAARRGILLLTPAGACSAGGAEDATLSTLAVVVLGTRSERKDACTYKLTDAKAKDKGQADSPLTLHDIDAKAYDRRSGKLLGTRKFLAPKNCTDEFATRSGERMISQASRVDEATVTAWAASLR